mgnify:CR=1 FL=1
MDQPISSRRRQLAAFIALAGGLAPALRAAAQNNPESGMRKVTGNVLVNGRPAAVGTPVRAGDTVVTGPGAVAMFAVGQDAFMMRAGSRASFSGQDVALDAVRLLSGRLLSVFGKGGPRQLVTSTATVGIRGTGAYLESEAERTYFCLCYGSAEVESMNGMARDTYSTTHHESPRYLYANRQERVMEAAGVINHTDAELIMLEALVDRTPPDAFMNSSPRY